MTGGLIVTFDGKARELSLYNDNSVAPEITFESLQLMYDDPVLADLVEAAGAPLDLDADITDFELLPEEHVTFVPMPVTVTASAPTPTRCRRNAWRQEHERARLRRLLACAGRLTVLPERRALVRRDGSLVPGGYEALLKFERRRAQLPPTVSPTTLLGEMTNDRP